MGHQKDRKKDKEKENLYLKIKYNDDTIFQY